MLTRQRQLGGQIAPGITLYNLFDHVFTINDQSTQAELFEEKTTRSKQLINFTLTVVVANTTSAKCSPLLTAGLLITVNSVYCLGVTLILMSLRKKIQTAVVC